MQITDVKMHQKDTQSFLNNNWLTAEAIYFGFSKINCPPNLKLVDPSLSTLILFENDWEDLRELNDNWQNYDCLLFAISDATTLENSSHWATLLFKSNFFYILDSSYNNQNIQYNSQIIARKIQAIIFQQECLLKEPIKIQNIEIPKQNNSYDCGIYVICVAEQIAQQLNQQTWNFNAITPQYVQEKRLTFQKLL